MLGERRRPRACGGAGAHQGAPGHEGGAREDLGPGRVHEAHPGHAPARQGRRRGHQVRCQGGGRRAVSAPHRPSARGCERDGTRVSGVQRAFNRRLGTLRRPPQRQSVRVLKDIFVSFVGMHDHDLHQGPFYILVLFILVLETFQAPGPCLRIGFPILVTQLVQIINFLALHCLQVLNF